ncbi:MAG: hypothetical protein KC561_07605 [Myxococcales bacterium]|nr:hypothetical protein [Myxococcales bacterium]
MPISFVALLSLGACQSDVPFEIDRNLQDQTSLDTDTNSGQPDTETSTDARVDARVDQVSADTGVDQSVVDTVSQPSDLGGVDASSDESSGTPDPDAQTDAQADAGSDLQTDIFAPDEPLRILFIGNSFTFGGPVPTIVGELAEGAGWPTPHIEYSAYGGETLEGHRSRERTMELAQQSGWDVAVIQEFSTRPTSIGDPEQFMTDATFFHDTIRTNSPDARIILYETWARHPDHGVYPNSFANPAQMQAELRYNYNEAATNWIPNHATVELSSPIEVAPVGDAWERHLNGDDPLRLHASDDYHANTNGQYLNALVIYSTIYHRASREVTNWDVAPEDASRLQADADATTGESVEGGPSGQLPQPGLAPGQTVRIDVGGADEAEPGWNILSGATTGARYNLVDTGGVPTTVDVWVSDGFAGVNSNGLGSNSLEYPASASSDTLFCGSFDGHEEGLAAPGAVTIGGLEPLASYRLRAFASRSGNDGGQGRLTRYRIGAREVDLEVSDNVSETALFDEVEADAEGRLELEVLVSPTGTGRFCYLGVLIVEGLAE